MLFSSIYGKNSTFNKFKSFGCETIEINGHNHKEILKSLNSKTSNKPKVIVANTVKGKGIKLFENDNNWHYRIPSNEEVKLAKKELEI